MQHLNQSALESGESQVFPVMPGSTCPSRTEKVSTRCYITCLTWLGCLEVQPWGERRRPHLIRTGDPHTVVRVTPQTWQDMKVRRNQNLLPREVPPPDGPPQRLGEGGFQGRLILVNTFLIIGFSQPAVCVTWMMQVDSSEWPVNPGFHDNVMLLPNILETWSPTGAAGKTKPNPQKFVIHSERSISNYSSCVLQGVYMKLQWIKTGFSL